MVVYRQLQLIVAGLNRFQQGVVLPAFLFACPVNAAITIAAAAKSESENVWHIAIMLLLATDCTLCMLVLIGRMPVVHGESKLALLKVRANTSENVFRSREFKWERKFYRSCPPLKVMIGYNNFVEEKTPLTCLNITMNLTVNLLLLY